MTVRANYAAHIGAGKRWAAGISKSAAALRIACAGLEGRPSLYRKSAFGQDKISNRRRLVALLWPGTRTITDLAYALSVSRRTIRRDLAWLEAMAMAGHATVISPGADE